MFCFHIKCFFKLGPCSESPSGKNKTFPAAQEAGRDQPYDVWVPELGCVKTLCYVKPPHKSESDTSLQIQALQHVGSRSSILFKKAYTSIPKNHKLFHMPHISNVLEKNQFTDKEDSQTKKDNSKKKKCRLYTSGD